jgi:hypothetical protein
MQMIACQGKGVGLSFFCGAQPLVNMSNRSRATRLAFGNERYEFQLRVLF